MQWGNEGKINLIECVTNDAIRSLKWWQITIQLEFNTTQRKRSHWKVNVNIFPLISQDLYRKTILHYKFPSFSHSLSFFLIFLQKHKWDSFFLWWKKNQQVCFFNDFILDSSRLQQHKMVSFEHFEAAILRRLDNNKKKKRNIIYDLNAITQSTIEPSSV